MGGSGVGKGFVKPGPLFAFVPFQNLAAVEALDVLGVVIPGDQPQVVVFTFGLGHRPLHTRLWHNYSNKTWDAPDPALRGGLTFNRSASSGGLGKREFLTPQINSQKTLGTVLFYAIIALLAYLVYIVFAPFLVALAWAVVLVVVSYPLYQRLSRRWGPTAAAAATTAAVTLILIVPTVFVMIAFVRQAVSAAQSLQLRVEAGHLSWVVPLWMRLQHRFPNLFPRNLSALLLHYAQEVAAYVGARLGVAVRHTAEFVFDMFVTVLAMFYLYRDGHAIVQRLREVLPFEQEGRERLVHETRELIYATVSSTLAAAGVHGALGGIAFAIAGVHAAVFWGVMMGFFSLVPLVGSALIFVPISISLMLAGHLGRGIFLIVFCSLIVGTVDNFVRPWLISGRAEMSGLVVFISVLGGIAVFGLLGVVLGPIVVALAASILDLYGPAAPRSKLGTKGGGKTKTAVLE